MNILHELIKLIRMLSKIDKSSPSNNVGMIDVIEIKLLGTKR